MSSFAVDVLAPSVRAQLERLASEPWSSHPRACLVRAVRSINPALSEETVEDRFGDLVTAVSIRDGLAEDDSASPIVREQVDALVSWAVDRLMPEVGR